MTKKINISFEESTFQFSLIVKTNKKLKENIKTSGQD